MTEIEALKALKSREPIFHRPELGTARSDFEAMIDKDFWEVGASGRVYDRNYVLDALEERHSSAHEDKWEVSDFSCRDLGGGTFLVTYHLNQDCRMSRRSTLWSFEGGEWRALYHQGTLLAD